MCDCLICAPSLRLSSKYEDHFFNSSLNHISVPHRSFHWNTWAQQIDLLASEWLHYSVGKYCTGIAKVIDLYPVEDTWNFSSAHLRQSLRLSTKCEGHSFNSFVLSYLIALKSWKCLLIKLSCHQTQIHSNLPPNELLGGSCLLFLNITRLFSLL